MSRRCARSVQRALEGHAHEMDELDELDATLVENGSSAFVGTSHNEGRYTRFLEHMLLDEHAPPDRGNTVIDAVKGFSEF